MDWISCDDVNLCYLVFYSNNCVSIMGLRLCACHWNEKWNETNVSIYNCYSYDRL